VIPIIQMGTDIRIEAFIEPNLLWTAPKGQRRVKKKEEEDG